MIHWIQLSDTVVQTREPWIVSDPNVLMGKPVVAGARITVELILEKLAAGETIDQILDAHPRLTREAIWAAPGICQGGFAGRCGLSGCRGRWVHILADEGVDRQVVDRLRQDGAQCGISPRQSRA